MQFPFTDLHIYKQWCKIMADVVANIIALWSGAIVDIPVGWVLCDGTQGTPNLQNRFILGAGDFFNPNDTGGSVNHNHDFESNGHSHTIPAGSGLASGANFDTTTDSEFDAGTTDNASSLPPYYALAYIMKT